MGKKKSGVEKFDEFYANTWGKRWEELKSSMLKSRGHVAVKNPFSDQDIEGEIRFGLEGVFFADHFEGPRETSKESLKPYYLMDFASYLAPMSLGIKEGEDVLDLCAAPGGKSLILAYGLKKSGTLVVNDRSRDRRKRLTQVMDEYLPQELRERVRVTGHDSSSWCLHEKEAYDKILLDAPCSSERHLLERPHHLQEWGEGRTKRLAMNQWTMLASAFQVLRVGGTLVYSTCSLSPLENDGVVEKLFKKFGTQAKKLDLELPLGESTKWGYQILPDTEGLGPFYLSAICRES